MKKLFVLLLVFLWIGCSATQTQIPTPEPILRTLTADCPQLTRAIDQMNQVIDLCNTKPEQCQEPEMVIRLDWMSTAINTVLDYKIFLEKSPQ
jgi:hypothetical protein